MLCFLYCWFWLVRLPPPSASTVGPAFPLTLAALTPRSDGFFFQPGHRLHLLFVSMDERTASM
ncbi:hypothetical protein I656_01911 [Geobacillus sp. WSUCF1]|nr:hypothetical protein I656_01911 [Geobacillus sp. WSUCF1]